MVQGITCEIWRLMDGWINEKAARVGIAMDQEVKNFAFADGANFRQRCYDFTLLSLSFDACIAGALSDFSADIRFLHLLNFEGGFDWATHHITQYALSPKIDSFDITFPFRELFCKCFRQFLNHIMGFRWA